MTTPILYTIDSYAATPRNEKGPRRRESLTLVGEHSGIPEQSPLDQRGAVAAKPDKKSNTKSHFLVAILIVQQIFGNFSKIFWRVVRHHANIYPSEKSILDIIL